MRSNESEREYEARMRSEGWVLMSVDGMPVDSREPLTPEEIEVMKHRSIFPEWHRIGEDAQRAVKQAWMYFCNDLDGLELPGEDAADQEAVIEMLDRFYAGLVEHMSVKDPVSIAAILAGDMGYDVSGARAVLSIVVQEQIVLMDLVRRLKSSSPPSGPPETLWEERHGMVDVKSRKRAAMRLLRKHKMLNHKE